MKPATNTEIQKRLNQLMRDYIEVIFDIGHMPAGRGDALVRAISCNNHMLNVALAIAAAEGLDGEMITKALDLGEETAKALIEKSLKNAAMRSTQ